MELISRSDWGRPAAQRIAEDKVFFLRFYPLLAARAARDTEISRRAAMKATVRGTGGQ